MQSQKYFIKGMVCERCIRSVKDITEDLGVQIMDINLGELALQTASEKVDEIQLEAKLKSLGFILLKDKKKEIIQDTKKLVAEVYSGDFDFPDRFRFSELAANRLSKDYETISSLFSHLEKNTLEKYIIDYRIEKIKEFLVYTEYSLSHIAYILGFSSVAHLSKQFKALTELNPSYFRSIKLKKESTKRKASEA